MSVEKRRMARCYNTKASTADHQLRIEFSGENKNGNQLAFTADMPFYFIPYLITELSKVWKQERGYRTSEIERIDAALPKEEA